MSAFLDVGEDWVAASELSIDLPTTTLTFDGQADALTKPDIDYRVLEAFTKRIDLMEFDYGRYVDSSGEEIPSRCIQEYDSNGKMFEEKGNIYAIWLRGQKGCDPGRDDYALNEDGSVTVSKVDIESDLESTKMVDGTSELSDVTDKKKEDEPLEDDDSDKQIIKNYVPNEKIYRTPQFTDWYKGKSFYTRTDGIEDDRPALITDEDGKTVYNTVYYKYTPKLEIENAAVTGIPHFVSNCITYSGKETEKNDSDGDPIIKWSASNSCKLVPEGVQITESANGRNENEELVLTFSASITVNPDAFAYRNKHVMAIGPNGQNVTDSYVQLEHLFTAPATTCADDDTECINAKENEGK